MLKEKFSTPIPKQLNKLDRKPSDFSTKSIQNILKGLTKKGLITDTKNTNLDCYHREYKIATFSSDSDVKYKVTHLLEEIAKIRAILYEKSLYWDESRHLEEIALDTVIRDILNHKINTKVSLHGLGSETYLQKSAHLSIRNYFVTTYFNCKCQY